MVRTIRNRERQQRTTTGLDSAHSSLHSDIVMFLKERSPKSVKEIRSLAEKYRTAHPSKPSILANVGVSKTNGRKQDKTK